MNKSDILRVQLRKQSKLPVHRWPMIEVHLILYLWKHKLIHNTHTLYPHKNIYSEIHIHTQQNQQLFKLYSKMLHSLWSTDHGILFLISHITNLEAQVNSALCNLPSCICGIFLLKNKRGVERSEGTPSLHQFSRSVMSNSLRPHGPQHARLPVHHQLLESTQIHVHWVGNAIQPSHPLSSPSPPAFNLSQHQGLFQWVSSSHQVSKVLEFQLQHPSSEHSGLISFRMDWLDLLAVQGTLKSLLQHHSSKASTLRCSAFFIIQLSHPNMTTGKTIALTRWTFAGKVTSLLFNMLSRLVITFLPRSKCLDYSHHLQWFWSPKK